MTEDDRAELNELKKKIPIDEYALELECKDQSVLYEEVVEIVSAARAKAKTLYKHIEFVKSDLYIKILKDPGSFGLSKTTGDPINATVVIQEEYQKALKESIEAEEYANALQGLQVSMEQRKSMIKELVSLFIHQYYSSQNLASEQRGLSGVTQSEIMEKRMELARQREEDEAIEESEV